MQKPTAQLNVRIPYELYQEIERLTARHGGTKVGVIIAAVEALKRAETCEASGAERDEPGPKPAGRKKGGTAPFGWKFEEGEYREHPEEQRARARLLELAGEGRPQAKIRDTLNAEGLPNRGGVPWKSNTVDNVLRAARKRGKPATSHVRS